MGDDATWGEELSWDEIRKRKRPSQRDVNLSLDPELALAYSEAEQKVEEAKRAVELRPADAARLQALEEAEEALDAARTALEPQLVTFKVKALGREAFEELVDDHKPTAEQQKRWRKENPQAASLGQSLRWNEDTFPVALLAACVVKPRLTESAAKDLWGGEVFNQGEAALLFRSCLEVNQNHRVVDLGKGSRPTGSSESASLSAVPTG